MKALTIGKIAGLAGVGVETVRFYEREGLIEQPPRKESGYRHYPYETISRILFVKKAKSLGFSLKEIKELLALQTDPKVTCDDIRKRAEDKIADIETKIRVLESMKSVLHDLITSCRRGVAVNECVILKALGGGEQQ